MKKVCLLIFCAVAFAAAAQPSENGKKKRPRKPVDVNEEIVSASEDVSGETDESFNDIMGSFSELALKFSEKDSREKDVFVYECKNIGGKAFSQALEPFLSVHGEISDCDESDLVIISDEIENLEQLKKIAASIDRPVRQVLVSAKVVEFQITDGFEKDISLQYNQFSNMDQIPALPGGGVADKTISSAFASRIMDAIAPSGGNPASLSGSSSYMHYDPEEQTILSAFLTFLEQNGTAQILSSPSLIMRRGHTGNILSGEDIPITESNVGSGGTSYAVEYKSVGIKLRVTPQSIFEDRVVLEVSPEVSNIIRYEESAAGRNPVIAIRNASTLLEMGDGKMVSIGGLLREEQIESVSQVPILGSIPVIGALFRSSSSEAIRSQLVIFLTVNVLDPSDLSAELIGTEGISDDMRTQIEKSREAFPKEERTFTGGLKKLFN